jgi:hypothetical protein
MVFNCFINFSSYLLGEIHKIWISFEIQDMDMEGMDRYAMADETRYIQVRPLLVLALTLINMRFVR